MQSVIYTIGHSNHELADFLALVDQRGVEVIADVRSSPYSRRYPQYQHDALRASLQAHDLRYVFLGRELGARREEAACYVDGQARYERVAALPAFGEGIRRLLEGAREYRVALMCAEADPLDCHRAILVARHLKRQGAEVRHILRDGSLLSQDGLEARLLEEAGLDAPQLDIFGAQAGAESPLDRAYRLRGERMAYRRQRPR